jgi:hypothetical protein
MVGDMVVIVNYDGQTSFKVTSTVDKLVLQDVITRKRTVVKS